MEDVYDEEEFKMPTPSSVHKQAKHNTWIGKENLEDVDELYDLADKEKCGISLSQLPWWVTENDVRACCGKFGEVLLVHYEIDKYNGMSKGKVLVVFAEEESANEAVKELHNTKSLAEKLLDSSFSVKKVSRTTFEREMDLINLRPERKRSSSRREKSKEREGRSRRRERSKEKSRSKDKRKRGKSSSRRR